MRNATPDEMFYLDQHRELAERLGVSVATVQAAAAAVYRVSIFPESTVLAWALKRVVAGRLAISGESFVLLAPTDDEQLLTMLGREAERFGVSLVSDERAKAAISSNAAT